MIDSGLIDYELAKTLLVFDGWEEIEASVFKKGPCSIRIGKLSYRSVGLQRFNGFGWGESRNTETVREFAKVLSEVCSSNNAIEALSEVADRLNDTIIYAFGDFGDWDNHAGFDEIPTDLMLAPCASHRETLAKIWKLREDVKSVLAGMV